MDAAANLTDQAQMALGAQRQGPSHTNDAAKAKKTGKDFEAMFMTQMLQHMFSGVDQQKDGMFGGGHAEQMFRPMLLEEYGKIIANRGNGIGLADHVTRSLLNTQEVQ